MNKQILIVEDEFVVANSLRLLLESSGYKVCGIAASATEAEALIGMQTPDLVILDIRLEGGRSGIDLAHILKSKNIGFVYLSANSSQQVLEEAKTTEPYGFLIKPFREKDLLVTLDIAWYRHHQSSEAKERREKYLLENIAHLCSEPYESREQLLALVRLLQPHLSYEFLLTFKKKAAGDLPDVAGYMRTGYDQHVYIGKEQLITMIGYNPFSSVAGDVPAAVYKGLSAKLDLVAQLCVELTGQPGETAHLCLYSRQHSVYGTEQTALLNKLKTAISRLLSDQQEQHQAAPAPEKDIPVTNERQAMKAIIGDHPLLLAALDLTEQVAPYNTNVLILGESGTGKENIAQAIHSLSSRHEGPFIKVNCAAIPATLMESELFGHEKGAFTGATNKRKGCFEMAEGGTLFLDEIGELSLDMQVKLLRSLQEKEVIPVGSEVSKKVDIRVVAATNRNLEKEVGEGNFRLDLYYRLNVFPIVLPPLRDRKTDIKALAEHFAMHFCRAFNKPYTGISSAMLGQLLAYHWPGNIRELENLMERSVILNKANTELGLNLQLAATTDTAGVLLTGIDHFQDIKKKLQESEREYLIGVLKQTAGRIRGVNGAAERLNMKPTTLESKMAKLGITRSDL